MSQIYFWLTIFSSFTTIITQSINITKPINSLPNLTNNATVASVIISPSASATSKLAGSLDAFPLSSAPILNSSLTNSLIKATSFSPSLKSSNLQIADVYSPTSKLSSSEIPALLPSTSISGSLPPTTTRTNLNTLLDSTRVQSHSALVYTPMVSISSTVTPTHNDDAKKINALRPTTTVLSLEESEMPKLDKDNPKKNPLKSTIPGRTLITSRDQTDIEVTGPESNGAAKIAISEYPNGKGVLILAEFGSSDEEFPDLNMIDGLLENLVPIPTRPKRPIKSSYRRHPFYNFDLNQRKRKPNNSDEHYEEPKEKSPIRKNYFMSHKEETPLFSRNLSPFESSEYDKKLRRPQTIKQTPFERFQMQESLPNVNYKDSGNVYDDNDDEEDEMIDPIAKYAPRRTFIKPIIQPMSERFAKNDLLDDEVDDKRKSIRKNMKDSSEESDERF